MKFTTTKQLNKRKQSYNTRATKTANGYSKHFAGQCPDKWLKLAVHGTLDVLAKQRFDFCWVTVQHPIDKDYTKQVKILTKNRPKYTERMPKDTRNKTIYKLI